MNDTPDSSARRLARGLGWASLGLGLPQVVSPLRVARLVGVDDSAVAPLVIRGVGVRELVHGVALLAGPSTMTWTRVVGDAVDIGALARALSLRSGERRMRTTAAMSAVLAITLVDFTAAVRAARDRQHGKGRPGPLQVEAAVTVNRSPEDVYEFWRDLTRLPTFMRHLESVTVVGEDRTHWVARAPLRRKVEWDAEMTGDDEGRRLSWKSLPGADIANSGTVHFAPAPDQEGTEVRVSLHYDVPGGAVGRATAKLFGEEPEQQVRDDLRRFKQVLETGDIVRSDALPEGTAAGHQFIQRPAQPTKAKGKKR